MQGRTGRLRLVQVILLGVETGRFVDQWFLGLAFLSLDAAAYSPARAHRMRAQWLRGHGTQALLGLAIFATMAEALRRNGRSEG